jgi:hypothetical protein
VQQGAGDLLSRPLIEIARDLHEKRAMAREWIEAAIARHERFPRASRRASRAEESEFAPDSPQEGQGFEPSVPPAPG